MSDVSFAVTVSRDASSWNVRAFDDPFHTPHTALNAVLNLRSEAAAFALLCVDNDYYVIVRPHPERPRFLLSDATMAVDDDFAATILEMIGAEIPDIDPAELDNMTGWPDGDFDLLEDLGLSEELLGVIADDQQPWPHESLLRIAAELGFEEELAKVAGLE